MVQVPSLLGNPLLDLRFSLIGLECIWCFVVSGVESGLFEKGQKLCVLCLVVSASCEDVRMQD